MPRNLPWKTFPSHSPPSNATESRSILFEAKSPASTTRSLNARLSKLPSSNGVDRSPSSSPPPPLPPSEEFMRPGLDGDDAYVMVEDDFLATARTFTARLHYAEYKRLQALAREKKRQRQDLPLADADSGDDSALPTILRRKKAASANLARSRAALQSLGLVKSPRANPGSPQHDGSSESGPEPEQPGKRTSIRGDHPWLGTSLAPLLSPRKLRQDASWYMPPSHMSGKRRLAQSNTRAAQGYTASAKDGQPSSPLKPEIKLPSTLRRLSSHHNTAVELDDNVTEDDDDDDLDAPHISRPPPKSTTSKSHSMASRLPSPPARTSSSRPKEVIRTEEDKGRIGLAQTPSIQPWMRGKSKDDDTSGRRKTVKVNEIPTFRV